ASTNDSDATIHYQWQHLINGTWSNVGADSSQYVLTAADEGLQIHVVATTSDTDDSATASVTSAATAVVTEAAATIGPVQISGSAIEGQVLTASASANDADATVTYHWFSSADGFTTAVGTGATYTVTEADESHTLKAVATATDVVGGTLVSATSAAITVNDVPVITPAADQTIGVGQTAAISGISLSETGNTAGETFTVTL